MSGNIVDKESQVSRKAMQLDQAITLLSETVAEVKIRLSPVLRPAIQEAAGANPVPPENLVELAQNLENKRERVSFIQQDLTDLLAKLEL